MASSSISKREWMNWAGEYAHEDTSTLVLSAPSSAFVDIRILLPHTQTPASAAVHPADTTASPLAPQSPPLLPNTGGPASRLDWAFAGFSETSPGNDRIRGVVHKKWTHVIDSRCGFDEEGTPDEGDLWDRSGGYSLETGIMKHPKKGVDVAYQEMWREVEIKAVNREPLRHAVVLTHHNPQLKSRGMIVRVGQYCQGIYMLDREVTVERWQWKVEWKEEKKRTDDLWRRTVKLGSRFLPCVWTFEPEKLTVGAKLMGPGEEDDYWEVKELAAW
ncbi:hypothetical protein IWX91DRAFT_302162 [Phyllosticta citricarpa]